MKGHQKIYTILLSSLPQIIQLKLTNKIFYTFLIALAIFIAGVQIGIAHGRELQRQEYYEYVTTN